jgi:hypothetical protein
MVQIWNPNAFGFADELHDCITSGNEEKNAAEARAVPLVLRKSLRVVFIF